MVNDTVSNFQKDLESAQKKKPRNARKDITKAISRVRRNWGLLTTNQKLQAGAVVTAIGIEISIALGTFLFISWAGFLIKESLKSDKDNDEDELRLLKTLRADLDIKRNKINDVI